MKTILVSMVILLVLTVQGFANPAAEKQTERQRVQDERRREAEERAYRQLVIEYLDRIARQRR
jgi:ABC-type Fe3+-citrate transport system substrate-binding protein